MSTFSTFLRSQIDSLLVRCGARCRESRTAQSVVARIELGETKSFVGHVDAASQGRAIYSRALTRVPIVDKSELDDVSRILAMTPEEKLEEVAKVSRFVAGAKRV